LRQVVLDTETTGLETGKGHKIIEIGGVEIVNRRLTGRHYHEYLNPQRDIDAGAQEVHGLSRQFLADKPLFEDVVADFLEFIRGAELVIHNAPFDVGFLEHELRALPAQVRQKLGFASRASACRLSGLCEISDSLALARHKHPGQKNSLDALCRRYDVDNSSRQLHGALLDAEILADVYLLMTGGQTALFDGGSQSESEAEQRISEQQWTPPAGLLVVQPNADESLLHEQVLDLLDQQAGQALWRKQAAAPNSSVE